MRTRPALCFTSPPYGNQRDYTSGGIPDWDGLMRGVFAEARRQRLKRITLEVRVSNNGAIRLYQSIGFQIAAIRRGYYQDTGEDAYIMWLNEIEPEEERKPTRFWRRTK